MRIAILTLLVAMLAAFALVADGPAATRAPALRLSEIDGATILREAWDVVNANFFDPHFNGVDWPAMLERYSPSASKARGPHELSAVVNEMLGELHTSHTTYYTQADREYYELLDIFNRGGKVSERIAQMFGGGLVQYEGIGIVARNIDGKVYIADVLDGSVAQREGLTVGDQVISADGETFNPVGSFLGKAGRTVKLVIQRDAAEASRREVEVTPQWIQPHEAFLKAIDAGARIIERGGKRIAYVRIRSYASESYQDALADLVTGDGRLADADSLVLDIRGGWGGANPDYLNLFNTAVPAMKSTTRDGHTVRVDSHWRKPVVLLVDHGTRSGKEILTHGFKKNHIGPIVGTRTAGAVVGGSAFILSDGSLMIVAVTDVRVDGVRLEGVGVEPDVLAELSLPHCAGRDSQVDRAVEEAAKLAGLHD